MKDRRLSAALELMRDRRVTVLAGAGVSTDSGIPDYRGPEGRLRSRSPMQYSEFVGSEEGRVRYWSRSAVGWARMHRAEPNEAHRALARMEEGGAVVGVITQNVDGLHQAAGSRRVLELHGSLDGVVCLDCGDRTGRGAYQERLIAANPGWLEKATSGDTTIAPDGDADVARVDAGGFTVPGCERCDGVIKPDVVFFGENVPRERVDRAWELYGQGDVLLVVGSSLTVFSGRRFVHRAATEGVPVVIATLGETRGDPMATVKLDERLGTLLPEMAEALLAR